MFISSAGSYIEPCHSCIISVGIPSSVLKCTLKAVRTDRTWPALQWIPRRGIWRILFPLHKHVFSFAIGRFGFIKVDISLGRHFRNAITVPHFHWLQGFPSLRRTFVLAKMYVCWGVNLTIVPQYGDEEP